MFPIGTDRPLHRPTLVTYVLLALCALTFIVEAVVASATVRARPPGLEGASGLFAVLWLDPRAVTVWGFVTYQFLHGGLMHLLGNMLFLWVFGPNVEDRMGRVWFLLFYLAGGAAAGAVHIAFEDAPVVGASGSIAAVTGAYLVLFPRTTIRTIWMLGIIGVFNIPATWFIGFAVAKDLFMQGLGGGMTAHLAHLGGYAFGALVAITLLATGLLAREPYDLFTIGRQAHRRRQFRELTSKGSDPWAGHARPAPKQPRATREDEEVVAKRAEVSRLAASGDLPGAAEAYRALLETAGDVAMSRQTQYDVANQLFASERYAPAAAAYRLFLEKNPRDREAPRVRLMLGLVHARYVRDPDAARELLLRAEREAANDDDRALARTLLEEVGAGAPGRAG